MLHCASEKDFGLQLLTVDTADGADDDENDADDYEL